MGREKEIFGLNSAFSKSANLGILSMLRRGLWALMMLAVLIACSDESDIRDPKILRVAVLPDETHDQLLKRHKPLIEYLAQAMGIEYELIIPDDYEQLGQIFQDGKADLAYFGGLTFIQAIKENGAQALVMRDIDANFTSTFLVRADNTASGIGDLEGESLAFGSILSTSGHLMPRLFLNKEGIDPEEFFGEVKYSGAHDKTAEWVRDGVATLGVVNSRVVERMYDTGRLLPGKVRILSKTPPYPDYVWALRKGVSEEFTEKLRNAFLSLSLTNSENADILEKAYATGFLPARNSDFSELEKIALSLGFLKNGSGK